MVDKVERVLGLYSKLINGGIVYRAEEAANYDVSERGISRDISDIREYLDMNGPESGQINTIVFDKKIGGYRLEQVFKQKFTNEEVLAICKILLDSRAFTKKEMDQMLSKLIESSVPVENQHLIHELIKNEAFNYIEPHHKSIFIDRMWQVGLAIHEKKYVEIQYKGLQGSEIKTRKVKPVAIMFSDMYFYMAAFLDKDNELKTDAPLEDMNPTIYRFDRMHGLKVLDEHFQEIYSSRFQEGEFRKRIMFMTPGKLRRVKFEYSGYSIDYVLDKLPTAEIVEIIFDAELGRNRYKIVTEVYGDGIYNWLSSQGPWITIV